MQNIEWKKGHKFSLVNLLTSWSEEKNKNERKIFRKYTLQQNRTLRTIIRISWKVAEMKREKNWRKRWRSSWMRRKDGISNCCLTNEIVHSSGDEPREIYRNEELHFHALPKHEYVFRIAKIILRRHESVYRFHSTIGKEWNRFLYHIFEVQKTYIVILRLHYWYNISSFEFSKTRIIKIPFRCFQ